MKTFRQYFTGGIRGCKYVLVNRNIERQPSPCFVPLSHNVWSATEQYFLRIRGFSVSFLQILSGFKGRLARLPYFGYSLLLLVLVLVPVLIGAGLIGMDQSRTDNVIVGGLLIAIAVVLGVWCG